MSRSVNRTMRSLMGKSKKGKKKGSMFSPLKRSARKTYQSVSNQLNSTLDSANRTATSMWRSVMGKSSKRGKRKRGGTRRQSRQLNRELRQLRF
jgi:hypothetical protein